MAMGKRKSEQAPMWVPTTDLPVSPGHPFYARLNAILDEAGFDRFAEEQCRAFYAPVMGRPSLPPGRYFCLLLLTKRIVQVKVSVMAPGLSGACRIFPE